MESLDNKILVLDEGDNYAYKKVGESDADFEKRMERARKVRAQKLTEEDRKHIAELMETADDVAREMGLNHE